MNDTQTRVHAVSPGTAAAGRLGPAAWGVTVLAAVWWLLPMAARAPGVLPEERQLAMISAALPPRAASTRAAPEFAHPPQVPASADRPVEAAHWNQFRGPNGQGVAPSAAIPVHFGPESNDQVGPRL